MRCTLATGVLAGLIVLAINLFGPGIPNGPPQQLAAQAPEQPQQPAASKAVVVQSALPTVLRKEVDVEFFDTSLSEATAFLENLTQQVIFLDKPALADEGIDVDTPINLVTTKTPLALVLNRMLKPLDLSWYYKDEILFITTETKAAETLVTKYYQVKPLLDLGYSNDDVMQMIELMTRGPWRNLDGIGGEMLFIGQMLTVKQRYQVHLEVADLLAALQQKDQPIIRLEPKEHAKLRTAFQTAVDVEFIETPLDETAAFLADRLGVPIVLDVVALEDEGIGVDTPISLYLKGKSLRTVLDLLLRDIDGTAVMQDGTILITTKTAAEEKLLTVIYHVNDVADTKGTLAQLVNAVQSVTEGPWIDIEGIGGEILTFSPGTMVVKQRGEIHQEIERLLENQRKAGQEGKLQPLPVRTETRMYRMSADTAEDLLKTLPEFVAQGTWQDENNDAPYTIRKVAAGQTFVKYPNATEPKKAAPPKPEKGIAPTPTAEPPAQDQFLAVPQAVLVIRHTRDVHREIETFINTLLPDQQGIIGVPLHDRPGRNGDGFGGGSGGGFFSVD